jgi:hypothetical protein
MDHACTRNQITPSLVTEDANIGTGIIPSASSVPLTGSLTLISSAFPLTTSVGRMIRMVFVQAATKGTTF